MNLKVSGRLLGGSAVCLVWFEARWSSPGQLCLCHYCDVRFISHREHLCSSNSHDVPSCRSFHSEGIPPPGAFMGCDVAHRYE